MPKFNLDINGVDDDAAEGFEVWSGPLPHNGTYDGKLKVAQINVIDPEGKKKSKNAGENRIKIGVELAGNTGADAEFNGFTAWGGVNLIESGKRFINQWLLALTDGSDEEFLAIKKAFYEGGLRVDEKKEHITAIGRWKVGSPNGELPIKVSLKQRAFTQDRGDGTKETRTNIDLASFLRRNGSSSAGGFASEEEPAEEPDEPDMEIEVGDEEVGEEVFDVPEEDADAEEPANA
jgi:hypothetical protein